MIQIQMQEKAGLRVRLSEIIENSRVQSGILILILINAVTLGLETSSTVMSHVGGFLHVLDKAILSVFVLEIVVRLYVHRWAFFRDPWSLFDFIVVGIALFPATGPFSVLRALRVLRVLRVLTIVPSMRRVVGALMSAIPGLISIALVLILVFYVSAVIATKLFGQAFPAWFGDLGLSLFTLFQIMTLESWSMGIVRPVMNLYPFAWIFFVPFILIVTMTMLNLFIAVIVNAMHSYTEGEHQGTRAVVDQAREHIESDLHAEMRALRNEIAALKEVFRNNGERP